MPGRCFLDTSVLVRAIESHGPDPARSTTSMGLCRRSDVCISVQVLGKSYRAVIDELAAQAILDVSGKVKVHSHGG